jgi:Uma2 family endonuclease
MAATTIPTTGLSYEDFVTLQERPEFEGRRLELIDGELLVSPTPTDIHQRVSSNLMYALEGHIRPRRLGAVFAAPLTVRLSAENAIQPDILYLRRERAPVLVGGIVNGAPDLVMEILSPSTRDIDLTRKKALYERFGVPEYWVIDVDARSVTVFALTDGSYVSVPVADGVARSAVILDFAIALTELFETFP